MSVRTALLISPIIYDSRYETMHREIINNLESTHRLIVPVCIVFHSANDPFCSMQQPTPQRLRDKSGERRKSSYKRLEPIVLERARNGKRNKQQYAKSFQVFGLQIVSRHSKYCAIHRWPILILIIIVIIKVMNYYKQSKPLFAHEIKTDN